MLKNTYKYAGLSNPEYSRFGISERVRFDGGEEDYRVTESGGKHYLQPYYEPTDDGFGERLKYLDGLTKRFFRHAPFDVEINRSERDIAEFKAGYEDIDAEVSPHEKKATGQMLIGMMMGHCQSLCRGMIDLQERVVDKKEYIAQVQEDAIIDSDNMGAEYYDSLISQYSPEPEEGNIAVLQQRLQEYFLTIADDGLRQSIDIRETGFDIDKRDVWKVMYEAASEVFKTPLQDKAETSFYISRAIKIGDAFSAIDKVAEEMQKIIGNSDELADIFDAEHLAFLCKQRACVRGGIPGDFEAVAIAKKVAIFQIEEEVAKANGEGISAEMLEKIELLHEGTKIMEFMAEMRHEIKHTVANYASRVYEITAAPIAASEPPIRQ